MTYPDTATCGYCSHKLNDHNRTEGCTVCDCLATPNEGNRKVEGRTPAPISYAPTGPAPTVDRLAVERARRRKEHQKTAATNKENEALRREVRKLRHANFILQRNYQNATTQGNYRHRYEQLAEAMQIIREVASVGVNGLPVEIPKTLEPWLGPDWARSRTPQGRPAEVEE